MNSTTCRSWNDNITFTFVYVVSLLAIILLFLAIVLLLPFGPLSPCHLYATRPESVWHLVGWSAVLVLTAGAATHCRSRWWMSAETVRHAADERAAGLVVFIVNCSLLLSLAVALVVCDRFANSADEYAFVFQARTLAQGRLWNDPPPLGAAATTVFTWIVGDKWVGQYPPAWPVLLAAAERVGLPEWTVNPLLGASSVALLGFILRTEGRPSAAWWAAFGLTLSPFFLFNAGSLFSHQLVATSGLAFVYFACKTLKPEPRSAWHAALAGAMLGLIGATRYFSAILIGLPFAIALLKLPSVRRLKAIAWVALGGLPFLVGLLIYQARITGDPFMPVYWVAGREVDHLYLNLSSLAEGARVTLQRFVELSNWTSPIVLLLYALALSAKWRVGTLRFYDFVFPVFVLGMITYPLEGGNRYGPRYYYDVYPIFILTIASGLADHFDVSGSPRVRAMLISLLAAGLAYDFVSLPLLVRDQATIVYQRQDLYRLIANAKLSYATVLIRTETGVECPMEIEDLARNSTGEDQAVLLLRGDMIDAASVRAKLPDRQIWQYQRDRDQPEGRLIPIP